MKITYLVELADATTFCESYDFSEPGNVRKLRFYTAGSLPRYWCFVEIERNTEEDCDRELWGQINDGMFENMRTRGEIKINHDRPCERLCDIDGKLVWVSILDH